MASKADFRATSLAEICGISLRQLERFFMMETGIRPQEWLNRLRLRRAVALLAEGKSIKEVAFELKYKQPSHFSREFKRAHGVSPSSTRVSHSLHPNVDERYEMSSADTPTQLQSFNRESLIEVHEKRKLSLASDAGNQDFRLSRTQKSLP